MSTEEIYSVDILTKHVQKLYPKQEERYYGTLLPYSLGGREPLEGISVWESEKGIPHWHYVTYGFTELYEKESEDLENSGYGFELTFRLEKGIGQEPPEWPVNLLQNLARYVFSTGNVFGNGHHISCNGPVALETDTKLTALGFRIDPELGELDTPNGHMVFLQAVAITEDEMNANMCWSGEKFLALMEEYLPLCVTVLSRKSFMENNDFHAAWRAGIEKDGSSTSFIYMDEVGIARINSTAAVNGGVLRLGAGHVEILSNMLCARVGKGEKLYLEGKDVVVAFEQGDCSGFGMEEENFATVILNDTALEEICGIMKPHAGTYPLNSVPLILEVVPTHIKDAEGNIIEIIE